MPCSLTNHYITFPPRETLEQLNVSASEMKEAYSGDDISGVGITIKGSETNRCVDRKGETYDFVSRYFAPWLGIPEDPVTGTTIRQWYKNWEVFRSCSGRERTTSTCSCCSVLTVCQASGEALLTVLTGKQL